MIWTPHPYQEEAVQLCKSRRSFGLFLQPGLGKTTVMLKTFLSLLNEGKVKRALVIAPLMVAREVWAGDNSDMHKWDDFRGLTIDLVHGPTRKKIAWESKAHILVLNPESLDVFTEITPRGQHVMRKEWRVEWPFDMLIIDESTMIKSITTQRYKRMRAIRALCPYRYVLTGTPTPNSLLDIYGQITTLDDGKALGATFYHFRTKYFYPSGFGGYEWKIQKDAERAIHKAIQHLVFALPKGAGVELPPLVSSTRWVTLPKDVRAVYKKMAAEFVVQLDTHEITAANAGVKSMKLRQIASGILYVQSSPGQPMATHSDAVYLHEEKLECLAEICREAAAPVFVGYQFQAEGLRASKFLTAAGFRVGWLESGLTTEESSLLLKNWKAGEYDVLLAHPQVAAHGLNLQAETSMVVWLSPTWNAEHREQFVRRVWRQGQTQTVSEIHIIAKATVESVVLKAVHEKTTTQDALLHALRSHVKEVLSAE